jgi:SAM-dependent methyltransferase
MDKNYYLEYYSLERTHWWFKVREKIIKYHIIKHLPVFSKPLKILNIGIATGRSTEVLSEFGVVTSVEYDKECCEFISQKLNIEITNASITELPFENDFFDIVCAFDVIEHVADDKKGVCEMKRVCKNNGLIYITVPAFMQLWSNHDIINHHQRRYVLGQVVEIFGDHSHILSKTYFNSLLFFPILSFRFFSKILPKKIRKDVGSDFSVINRDSFFNKILYAIFSLEKNLLKVMTFPVGVSILFIWRK